MIQRIQLNQIRHYLKKGQYKNEETFLRKPYTQKFLI